MVLDGESTDEWRSIAYVKNYFQDTTVHGFRYIVEGWSILERLSWIVVISCAIGYSSYLVHGSIQEFNTNPIATTFDFIPIAKVPFPAVSLDAGQVWNPWGYIQTHLRHIINDEQDSLNERFRPMLEASFELFYSKIHPLVEQATSEEALRNWTTERSSVIINGPGLEVIMDRHDEFYVEMYYGTIEKLLFHQAALALDFPEEAQRVEETKLAKWAAFGVRLGIPFPSSPSWDSWYFTDRIDEYFAAARVVPSNETLELCLSWNETCLDSLLAVGSKLVTMLIYNSLDQSIETDLGHFLSKTSLNVGGYPFLWNRRRENQISRRRVARSQDTQQPYVPEDDLVEDFFPGEEVLAQFLVEAGQKMFNTSLEITLYELGQVMDLPYTEGTFVPFHVNSIGKKLGCFEFYYNDASQCQINRTDKIEPCCQIQDMISQRHEPFLKLMKYNQQQPQLFTEEVDIRADFEEAVKHFSLPLPPFMEYKANWQTFNPRVLLSDWNYKPPWPSRPKQKFFRSFSNLGLGYTFNQMDFEDVFQDTPYLKMFKRIMVPKGRRHEIGIHHSQDASPQEALHLLAQTSEYYPDFITFADPRYSCLGGLDESPYRSLGKQFKVSLHDPSQLPDLKNNFFELEAGQSYKVLITPTVIRSEPGIESLSESARNCRFSHEIGDSKIFKHYSKTGCLLECSLRLAVEQCRCLPWNYPQFEVDGRLTNLCDWRGNHCVNQIMVDTNQHTAHCKCLPECDRVSYSYSISPDKLDDMCNNFGSSRARRDDLLYNHWYNDRTFYLSKGIQSILTGQSLPSTDFKMEGYYCEWKQNQTARLILQLAGTDVTRITQSPRTSFIGALANLGGLVGLFTGMSLLSVYEVIFWLGRFIRDVLFKPYSRKSKVETEKKY